jgi:hypothetical protein
MKKITEIELVNIIKSLVNEVDSTATTSTKTPCTCPPGYTLMTGCICVRQPDPPGTIYKK